ncbi:MAG: DUF4954 domain-containing protein, partial [Parafilimonas sp.]
RNAWKYNDRDNRAEKFQLLEYDYLAPDSVNEMFEALRLLEIFTGKAWFKKNNAEEFTDEACMKKGEEFLQQKNEVIDELEITATGFENSKRKVIITKAHRAYDAYSEMILYYGLQQLIEWIEKNDVQNIEDIIKQMQADVQRSLWLNIGGQLMPAEEVNSLKNKIKSKEINSWDELHETYASEGEKYASQKLQHALASLLEIENINAKDITAEKLNYWFDKAVDIATSLSERISASRKKDYTNPFRKMVYDSETEMDNVLGKFDENSFVLQQQNELEVFKKRIEKLKVLFSV